MVEARQTPHIFILMDEAEFRRAITCHRGRNVTGQQATVDVPGQRGASCVALSNDGSLLYKPLFGPYSTEANFFLG